MIRRLRDRYWPLAMGFLAVLLVREVLTHLDFSRTTDGWLLLILGMVISISVVIMIWDIEDWTLRALGVFGLIAFDAAYYSLNGTTTLWDAPEITDGITNGLRAMIIVAAALLFTSQVIYIRHRVRCWWRKRKRAQP